MRSLRVLALMAVFVATALVTSCGSQAQHHGVGKTAAPAAVTVEASVSRCGQGWSKPAAGWQHFTVHNADRSAADVTIVDPGTGAIYAVLDPLGPGRSAAMTLQLGPGRYAFRCAVEDEPVVMGPVTTISGGVAEVVPPVVPVTAQDLIPATRAYTSYVGGQLPLLISEVRHLEVDLAAKHRAAAEADWLTAHLRYERLGAAYGAFGDADAAINGLPSGLPKGLQDRDFTGFHRIEWGLWNGQSLSAVHAAAAALEGQVAQLRISFTSSQIDPLEVSIRAHEITENALQFELTGRTDFGSHSELSTVRANLEGTSTLLRMLSPLLTTRYPALAQTTAAVTRAQADIAAQAKGRRLPALTQLTRPAHERIDADLSDLSELLAPVASILEPRRNT